MSTGHRGQQEVSKELCSSSRGGCLLSHAGGLGSVHRSRYKFYPSEHQQRHRLFDYLCKCGPVLSHPGMLTADMVALLLFLMYFFMCLECFLFAMSKPKRVNVVLCQVLVLLC